MVDINRYQNDKGLPVEVTSKKPLPVTNNDSRTAFGEILVAQEVALVQLKFVYNINPRLIETAINSSGSVISLDSCAVLSTDAVANSQAALFSRVPGEYQPGFGISAAFTALFTDPKEGSEQMAGIGNPSDGYFFGFFGTEFAVHVHSNGAEHVELFEVTAPATSDGDITFTLDGDSETVAILTGDTEWDIARKVFDDRTKFNQLGDGWRVIIEGKKINFKSYQAKARSGAFTYDAGVTGSTSTVAVLLEGRPVDATATQTIPQSEWNEDTMDGQGPSAMVLDTTKLNVFRIQFQYLGAGSIEYFIEDEKTTDFILVHKINYTNNNILPSIQNPTLPLCISVINDTNDTNMIVRSASMGLFLQGQKKQSSLVSLAPGIQTISAGVETAIFATHIPPTFNGIDNRTIVKIFSVQASSDGTKPVRLRLYPNPTVLGEPDYNLIAPTISSVKLANNSGISATGEPFFSGNLDKEDAMSFDLQDLNLEGTQGGTLVLTAESDNNSVVEAELIFTESQ